MSDGSSSQTSETENRNNESHSEYTHISPNELTLEAAIEELEDTIEELDSGDIELVKGKALYEQGQELIQFIESEIDMGSGSVSYDTGVTDTTQTTSAAEDYT